MMVTEKKVAEEGSIRLRTSFDSWNGKVLIDILNI